MRWIPTAPPNPFGGQPPTFLSGLVPFIHQPDLRPKTLIFLYIHDGSLSASVSLRRSDTGLVFGTRFTSSSGFRLSYTALRRHNRALAANQSLLTTPNHRAASPRTGCAVPPRYSGRSLPEPVSARHAVSFFMVRSACFFQRAVRTALLRTEEPGNDAGREGLCPVSETEAMRSRLRSS